MLRCSKTELSTKAIRFRCHADCEEYYEELVGWNSTIHWTLWRLWTSIQ